MSERELRLAIRDLLQEAGIEGGDVVLVHSGVGQLSAWFGRGRLRPGEIVAALHGALAEAVGRSGTIVAPGFFYDYARKSEAYVVEKSPPARSLGFYPPYLFRRPGCRRSLNPIANLLALGSAAERICAHDSAYGFGLSSPWARLVELRAKALVIGTPFVFTFLHHAEALVGPPHLYNKIFHAPVFASGRQIELPVVNCVRYLDFEVEYQDDRLEADLLSAGIARQAGTPELNLQLIDLAGAQDHCVAALARDPFYLLKRAPKFVAGRVPDDSIRQPRGAEGGRNSAPGAVRSSTSSAPF